MDRLNLMRQGIFFFARARAPRAHVYIYITLFAWVSLAYADSSKNIDDLNSSDLSVKYAALENLSQIPSRENALALSGAARTESDIRFTLALLDRIASMHHENVIPEISPLLKHDKAAIRKRTAQTIGLLGGATAEKPLLDALKTEKIEEVMSALIQALSLCGTHESLSAIKAAQKSGKPKVQEHATQALERLEKHGVQEKK